MAETTRLAKLPGYDTAPDVYETPELTDDASTTLQTASPRTPSESAESEADDAEADDHRARDAGDVLGGGGISRRHLFPERARSRFQAVGGRVETRGVDLSDRVDGRRRGFRVRRRRVGAAGEDDGEEEESLEARIARLRREVEECRVLAGEGKDGETNGEGQVGSEVEGLGRALADLETAAEGRRSQKLQDRPRAMTNGTAAHPLEKEDEADDSDERTLGKVAAFDSRLAALERALGISTLDATPGGAFTSPLLPSLDLLDQQMSALTTATSLADLDAAGSRIKKLAAEAEQLAQLQTAAGVASNGDESSADGASTALSQDDMAKLALLYGLLPTLQGLAPTVPVLLERLRSLRALHAGAAGAAGMLDELERRQAEMDDELVSWRDGLKRVEAVVKSADEANGRNGKVVQGWVKGLEARVRALNEQES